MSDEIVITIDRKLYEALMELDDICDDLIHGNIKNEEMIASLRNTIKRTNYELKELLEKE